jgi:LacI family transcriptional regulator
MPRVTQKQVAHAAGVSQGLVSLLLRGQEGLAISAETRERVLATARRLGYMPDRAAQMLRLGRTWTIACAVPDITNPFYPALERGVHDVATRSGYDVIAINTDGTAAGEQQLLDWCRRRRVDGLVGVFFTLSAADLAATGIAVVRIEARPKEASAFPVDSLFVSNERAAAEMTSYLLSRGHTAIAMISPPDGPGPDRLAGYTATMRAAGQAPWIEHATAFSEAEGEAAADRLLGKGARPSAIFAANDLLAAGCMRAIRARGLGIPRDIAVAGFDNIPLTHLFCPPLTTIDQFQHNLGKTAATMLLERVTADDRERLGQVREMPFELVRRKSV